MLAGSGVSASPALAQFRVESQAVLVDVAVSDGGPVLDLREEDFELYEGGEATSFRLLDPASLPVAVVFAMDVSASTVGERQRRLGEGAALFAGGLTRRDSCAVIAFSMEPFWTREFAPCAVDVRTDVRTIEPGGPDLGSGQRDPLPRGAPSGRRPESAPVVHRRVRQPELVIGRPGDDGRTGVPARSSIPSSRVRAIPFDSWGRATTDFT